MNRYSKRDAQFKKRIETGVARLKVIVQIIERREQMGLTQSQLAKRMGVSQPFIADGARHHDGGQASRSYACG